MTLHSTLTPAQRRLATMIEDPRARARWAPRSRRRSLVLAQIVVALLSVVAFAVAIVTEGPIAFVPFTGFILLGALTLHLAAHINVAARWSYSHPTLDEFQRAEMDRAALLGHNLTKILLTVLVTVASALGGAMISVELPGALVIGILLPMALLTALCHGAFPAAYLAWTRPDEIFDDEDEPDVR